MSDRRRITATYRLQLHAGFGFAEAAEVVPYLAQLGVSHLYLSPILQAAPGSLHGYDVVDHSRVSDDLGGEGGLVALADRCHEQVLGIVIDLVPNHMAVPTPLHLNRPLWETLRDGPDSPAATWFDIDWELCDGRLGLPVLGDPLDDVLATGSLQLGEHDGERVIRYGEQVFPVRPGSTGGDVREVLAQQHYLLANWRDKADVLGYRRFFDVDTLIAVRVELSEVFDATHAVPLDLYRRGIVDGFRIDHPDGLADPEGYLEQLRDATDGAWVVVEKILVGNEQLPTQWPTAGTTGYDALRAIQSALTPGTRQELDRLWTAIDGGQPGLPETEHEAKAQVVADLLQPEVQRLARRAVESAAAHGRELSHGDVLAGLSASLAEVTQYRAYVRLDREPGDEAQAAVASWEEAGRVRPGDGEAEPTPLTDLLLDSTSADESTRDLVVRFQQVCGPVMAKGVEDTTFYRWHRFVALNEVGGDPADLDHPPPERLHRWAVHQAAAFPLGLVALSTHDTKRDEDVRAQLMAAGRDIDSWQRIWGLVRARADEHGVDGPTAYLIMQTLVGAWPISRERIEDYLTKAVREAKVHSTWTEPDTAYEESVHALAVSVLRPDPVGEQIAAWVDRLNASGALLAATLAAKVLHLTLPGVPDIYQGTEHTRRLLVDPDNRRPVDFATAIRALDRVDAWTTVDGDAPLDYVKLAVTSRLLRLRQQRPELFWPRAGYRPLDLGDGLVGFARGSGLLVVVTADPELAVLRTPVPGLVLPEGEWVDALTARRHRAGEVSYNRLLGELPAAVLVEGGP